MQVKRLDRRLLDNLSRQALASPRLRDNYNFHRRPDDPVQRLCIALEPDSYVRPHRHPERNKWEMLIVLEGRATLLVFDEDGYVGDRIELDAAGDVHGIEIAANTWHTLVADEPGTVLLEVKQGPYTPVAKENFASWSPDENAVEVPLFMAWCRQAGVGDHPTR